MREGIHPKYFQATVTCNCGNTFVTGSTSKEIHVEVCSKCHSFYTGTQKTAAAKGRIDKSMAWVTTDIDTKNADGKAAADFPLCLAVVVIYKRQILDR